MRLCDALVITVKSSDFILSSMRLHWKVLGEVLRSTPGAGGGGVIVRAQLMITTMIIAGSDLSVGHILFFK